MRIHIASAGPSLLSTIPSHTDEMIIAINRAGSLVPHDWQVHGDDLRFGTPRVGYCCPTFRNTLLPSTRKLHIAWEHLSLSPNKDVECNYSVVAALDLAFRFARVSDTILIHGCDMRGEHDCQGQQDHHGRTVERWRCEAFDLQQTVLRAVMRKGAATVYRVLPYQPEERDNILPTLVQEGGA